MTRTDVRKQLKNGWVTQNVAAMLLGYDLDLKKLEPLTTTGVINTRKVQGQTLLKAFDVLGVAHDDLNELLDRYWPINRQKKSAGRQQVVVFANHEERQAFQRKWNRLHRRISSLIANPEEDINFRELKLIHQLMELSHRINAFEIIVTAAQLSVATGLNDEYLPKTRRSLERRELIRTKREGTLDWLYILLDPDTGCPFADGPDADLPVTAHEHWASFA